MHQRVASGMVKGALRSRMETTYVRSLTFLNLVGASMCLCRDNVNRETHAKGLRSPDLRFAEGLRRTAVRGRRARTPLLNPTQRGQGGDSHSECDRRDSAVYRFDRVVPGESSPTPTDSKELVAPYGGPLRFDQAPGTG